MQVEINEKLLDVIRQLAEEQGRTEEEVVEDAMLFYTQALRMLSSSLKPDTDIRVDIGSLYLPPRLPENFEELFDRAESWQRERGVGPLSDEEALELANEELHAMRRERKDPR